MLFMVGMTLALGLGCADEPVEDVSRAEPDPSPPVPKHDDSKVAPAHDDMDGDRIAVFGMLATTEGARVADRAVILVDATGERRELRTDGRGKFVADEIAVPYDLAVAPGVDGVPTVILGLARRDPYVEVSEHEILEPVDPPSQTLRVGVPAPVCPAPVEDGCFVAVVTGSRSGRGGGRGACSGKSGGAVVVDARHVWRGHDVAAGERIDVHVLTACTSTSTSDAGEGVLLPTYGYATLSEIAPAPGETTDLGMVRPHAVPTMPPMNVGARDPGELASWSWSIEVSLDVPSGSPRGEMVLMTASSPAAPLVLPRLPASSFFVHVRAGESRPDMVPGFDRSVEAWSGARAVVPLADPPPVVAVEVAAGPELARPAVGATVAPRDVGFEWTSAVPALASLLVVDLERGPRFRVLTDEEEVPYERLEALGFDALHEGGHLVDLTTSPRRRLDEATSPDPSVRNRYVSGTRGSAETRLRAPFEVLR
jgi:hypothetical protein